MIIADDPMLEAVYRFRIGRYRLPSRTREKHRTTLNADASEARKVMEENGLQYLLVYENDTSILPHSIVSRVNCRQRKVKDCQPEPTKEKPVYGWQESYITVLNKTKHLPYILVSQKGHESFRTSSYDDVQNPAYPELELVELTDIFLDSHDLRMLAFTLVTCLEYWLRDMIEEVLQGSKKHIQEALNVSLGEKYYTEMYSYWQSQRRRGSQKTFLECFSMYDLAQTLYVGKKITDAQLQIFKHIKRTRNALAHSQSEVPFLLDSTRNAYDLLLQLLLPTIVEQVKIKYAL